MEQLTKTQNTEHSEQKWTDVFVKHQCVNEGTHLDRCGKYSWSVWRHRTGFGFCKLVGRQYVVGEFRPGEGFVKLVKLGFSPFFTEPSKLDAVLTALGR